MVVSDPIPATPCWPPGMGLVSRLVLTYHANEGRELGSKFRVGHDFSHGHDLSRRVFRYVGDDSRLKSAGKLARTWGQAL